MSPRLLAGAVTTGVVLLGASSAQAATVNVNGSATTLKLDPAAAKALTSLGVRATPTGGAKASSAGIAFPIRYGRIDPATGLGVYKHTGGLRLSKGRTRVTLSSFTIAANKASTMSAVVGGKRAGLLIPVIGKARVARDGLGTTVSGVDVHLSTKGAAALNKAFHVKAFKPRLKLGTATIAATPSTVAFTGGQTDLKLDPAAAGALTSLGVTPGLIGPATANPDGSFAFPITGGEVNAKSLAGTIDHKGGISLTKGSTVVRVYDFIVDTRNKQLTARVGDAGRVAILSLDLSAPQVTIDGRAVAVGNVTGKLTAPAAVALNQAFGTTAFAEGLTLGVATVRGQGA